MILTPAQIEEITGFKRRAAQERELRALKIPYQLRTDGSIVVFAAHVGAPAASQPQGPTVRALPTRRIAAA